MLLQFVQLLDGYVPYVKFMTVRSVYVKSGTRGQSFAIVINFFHYEHDWPFMFFAAFFFFFLHLLADTIVIR
jgi:hypothetical protein